MRELVRGVFAILVVVPSIAAWQAATPQVVAAATQDGIDGAPVGPGEYAQDEVLIQYKAGWPEKGTRGMFAGRHGMLEKRADPDTDWFSYKITDGKSVDAKMKELLGADEVAKAIPNVKVQLEWAPTGDELYSQQWALPKVNMAGAWNYARGGLTFPNFIAIIDSGAPMLANGTGPKDLGNWLINGEWYGHNVDPTEPNDFEDCFGHGTLVASIAGAMANNGGMVGPAFNTGLMPVKFTDCGGGGYADEAALAIEWAVTTGHARVINASFGFHGSDAQLAMLKAAVDHAWSHNISVVAASGNDGLSDFSDLAPARWYHAIAVAATGRDDKSALAPAGTEKECHYDAVIGRRVCTTYPPGFAFSNHGAPGLDLSAPGIDMTGILVADGLPYKPNLGCSSKTGSCYTSQGIGTSFAAPLVSGTISLMLQRRPSLTATQVKTALWLSSDRVGGYNYNWKTSPCPQSFELGCGRLNAQRAVTYNG